MRVTGGKVKGIELKTLQGHSIRPSTGIVRRAIFSILENTAISWNRVLDLYAGTGALGIEALSREAEWVDFVEHRKKCCDIIKYNLGRTGRLDNARVYCCSVSKALTLLSDSYDIIFLDPPYSDPTTDNVLAQLANSKLIAERSTIVICHGNRFPLNTDYDGLRLSKQRRYGDSYISIYRRGG
jgi:16S rRNA (guanine966-N2)-methyltransferase